MCGGRHWRQYLQTGGRFLITMQRRVIEKVIKKRYLYAGSADLCTDSLPYLMGGHLPEQTEDLLQFVEKYIRDEP
jgi:hypothetical protein